MPRDKLIERLNRLMRTTLAFAEEVARGRITEGRIAAAEQRINADLLDVLNMADQARFEGRRGAANSAAGIQAATTIIRIAYRFGIIARGRLSGSEALLSDSMQRRLATVDETLCAAYASALREFERVHQFEPAGLPLEAPPQRAIDLKPLIDELAVAATLEERHWSSDSRSVLITQLESYHRLAILLGSLRAELSSFAVS